MKTILEKLQEDKVLLEATCLGNKKCGQCKVKIGNINIPITTHEKKLLTHSEIISGIRLACCHEYNNSMTIQILNDTMEILDDIYINQKFEYDKEEGFGVIIDIGTTTIVMKWINLLSSQTVKTESFKNPQASYGGDVISRIHYDTENPKILHQIIIESIEEQLIKNNIYRVKRMIVCGNTTMTHLFLGLDIESLGHLPFEVPIISSMNIHSDQLFKKLDQTFDIYTFPHASAFVGGDIISGIYVSGIYASSKNQMLLDLGTNGEIVVGNKEKIVTTSTAAGPAFEGYGMTCGGPSIPGAITKVRIQQEHVFYDTIMNEPAICLCGSGIISLIAELQSNHIINDLGRFHNGLKAFYITESIFITEKDIQAFQFAKAAIQVGITVLLKELPSVETIYISGGFGSKIDVQDLVKLNILSADHQNKVKIINNSALSGAYSLLLSKDYQAIEYIRKISSNINLAEYPNFNDLMIEGLYFNV